MPKLTPTLISGICSSTVSQTTWWRSGLKKPPRQPKRNNLRKKSQLRMMTFSETHQPQPKLQSQNLNLNQRKKKLNQSPNLLLSLMSRLKTPKLILMLWPRRFWILKLKAWFGTTNQRRSTLPMEFKSSKWVVLLKMPRSLLTIFSNQSKPGKKFNQLIWSACKSCDWLYDNLP